jgi:hypothetical protein
LYPMQGEHVERHGVRGGNTLSLAGLHARPQPSYLPPPPPLSPALIPVPRPMPVPSLRVCPSPRLPMSVPRPSVSVPRPPLPPPAAATSYHSGINRQLALPPPPTKRRSEAALHSQAGAAGPAQLVCLAKRKGCRRPHRPHLSGTPIITNPNTSAHASVTKPRTLFIFFFILDLHQVKLYPKSPPQTGTARRAAVCYNKV